MKKKYIIVILIILGFKLNAQNVSYSLSYIGANSITGNLEIALIATPDFNDVNGNSADMGAVIAISGGGYLLPTNTGFVNNCVFTPPATNICDYDIPSTEWDANYLSVPSTSSGNFVYQLTRTPVATNVFFDAIAATPIILAVFQVTTGIGAPTSGDITLIDNSDVLINAIPNENYFNINYSVSTSGSTIDILNTVDTSVLSFSVLGINDVNLVSNKFSLYPNPSAETIYVAGLKTDAKVSIYSISGKEVISVSGYSGAAINVSALTSGVYLVSIESENSKEVKRLVIQ